MKSKLLTLLACCLAPVVCAQTTEERFAAELAAKSRGIEWIACDFTETRHVQVLADDVVREGRFSYRSPARMALDFASGDRIVMDGERFVLQAEGRTTTARMNSNPMLRQLQTILDACMTGSLDRLRLSGRLEIEPSERGYRLQLVPSARATARYASRIVLSFDRRDMTLDELRLEQPSGDFTHYRFRNKRLNEPVDEAVFHVER